MISVELVPTDRYDDIAAFYTKVGYGKKPQATDSVLRAYDRGRLVGATRISKEHGVLVLRGMYVETQSQRRGIGRQLLDAVAGEIGSRECWCIPYAHLDEFYSRIGFKECDPDVAPAFLRERVSKYRELGRRVMIMRLVGSPKTGFR